MPRIVAVLLAVLLLLAAAPANAQIPIPPPAPAPPGPLPVPPLPEKPGVTTTTATTATASAAGNPVVQQVTNVLNLPPMPSPAEFAKTVFQGSLVLVLGSVADMLGGVVDGISGGGHNFILSTPPDLTYTNGVVRDAWTRAAEAAGLGLVLLAVWSALCITVAPVFRMTYEEALALLPRLALGAVLVGGSLWLGGLGIELNNALASSTGATLPTWDQPLGIDPKLPDVLARLAYLVAALVLVLQMLMRLAKLDVLLVLSPIAWLLWVAPQTRSWWGRWAQHFVGTTFAQFIQLLALKLGVAIISTVGGQGVVPLFLGSAVLWLVFKIPSMMEGYASTGWVTAFAVTRVIGTAAKATGTVGAAVATGVGTAAGTAARLWGAP